MMKHSLVASMTGISLTSIAPELRVNHAVALSHYDPCKDPTRIPLTVWCIAKRNQLARDITGRSVSWSKQSELNAQVNGRELRHRNRRAIDTANGRNMRASTP